MPTLNSLKALAEAGIVLPNGSGGGKAGKNCTIQKTEQIPGGNRVTFAWTADNGSQQTVSIDVMDGTGGGALEDELRVTKTVGGVSSGKTYPEGTTVEQILKDMLNPVTAPTMTSPSATLSSNAARTIYGFDESIGAITFTLSFNRGSISSGGYRAGEATGYSIDGKDGQSISINMDEKLTGVGSASIRGSVSFGEGDQPRYSDNSAYGTPLAAGSVNSNPVTFEKKSYVYTTKSGAFARMPIAQYNASPLNITLPNGDGVTSPVCKIGLPARATAILVKNEMSGQMVDASSEFAETIETIDGRTYYCYTDDRGFTSGDREMRFTW